MKFFVFNAQKNEVENWHFDQIPDLLYKNKREEIFNYSGLMNERTVFNFIKT